VTAARVSDLRSDTVTRPTAGMRRAMAGADVGDDAFGDDPTVIALENAAAALLGTEASLFCPTGTMANQVAIRTHCGRGDEVLLHEGCHVFRFEQGGMAALHGVQARTLPGPRGEVPVETLDLEVRPDDQHHPRTRLVVLENTFNWGGGIVLGRDYVAAVLAFARRRGLRTHLDGARLMNAAVAAGVRPAALAAGFDSVTLCLSKGLGAPAGTMLCGSAAFVAEARRGRKLLGGAMRQAGVLAAAGLLAIADPPDPPPDHTRARRLAAFLRAAPGVSVAEPETNIVIASLGGAAVQDVLAAMKSERVLAVPFGPGRIRFVTHRDLIDEDISRAADAFGRALATGKKP
jgi:threonine aldolase